MQADIERRGGWPVIGKGRPKGLGEQFMAPEQACHEPHLHQFGVGKHRHIWHACGVGIAKIANRRLTLSAELRDQRGLFLFRKSSGESAVAAKQEDEVQVGKPKRLQLLNAQVANDTPIGVITDAGEAAAGEQAEQRVRGAGRHRRTALAGHRHAVAHDIGAHLLLGVLG